MSATSSIMAFITNIIVLLTSLVQIHKLKKEIHDVKIVINNTMELKEALKSPLEGAWTVSGKYIKYHNRNSIHYCAGYVHFYWDELSKRYKVYYTYSVREEQSDIDLVTAICTGIGLCNEIGDIKNNDKLCLRMSIENRSAKDNFNNSSKNFEFISQKVKRKNNKINEISFVFKNSNVDGIIKFIR